MGGGTFGKCNLHFRGEGGKKCTLNFARVCFEGV